MLLKIDRKNCPLLGKLLSVWRTIQYCPNQPNLPKQLKIHTAFSMFPILDTNLCIIQGLFSEILSKKYWRQISILGTNYQRVKNQKNKGTFVMLILKVDITTVPLCIFSAFLLVGTSNWDCRQKSPKAAILICAAHVLLSDIHAIWSYKKWC